MLAVKSWEAVIDNAAPQIILWKEGRNKILEDKGRYSSSSNLRKTDDDLKIYLSHTIEQKITA